MIVAAESKSSPLGGGDTSKLLPLCPNSALGVGEGQPTGSGFKPPAEEEPAQDTF